MRTLLGVVIVVIAVLALVVTNAGAVSSAPSLALVNLTRDAATELNPTISWTPSGDLAVAWEQVVITNGVAQRDIVARVEQNGSFGPAMNISNDAVQSKEPWLFAAGPEPAVVYENVVTGPNKIFRSDWSGSGWSAPQVIAGGDYRLSLGPVAVQATDGSTWLTRWVRTTGNYSDIIVQQIGGPKFNVSADNRGWRHPALVAGSGGAVYVAWVDHTYVPSGYAPGIRLARVTAAGFKQMKQPTTDYFAFWPSLAFVKGQIYTSWLATTKATVRDRVWNGAVWSRQVNVGPGEEPHIAVTASGTIYVVWQASGKIYLRSNTNPAMVVSGNLAKAGNARLTVDGMGNAHVTFAQGGDIWYVEVPAQ